MKNIKLTIRAVLITMVSLTMMGGFLGKQNVAAQGLSNNSGSGAQLFCTRDFSNFLANGVDLNGEGFTDYWLDILDIPGVGWSRYSSNYCRFMDIDSLLTRVDKSRKQLRQAFYVCDDKTAQRIAGEYYQLSAELYYLRHFVDTTTPPSADASEEEKAQAVKKKTDIWTKWHEQFVTKAKYFPENQAPAIFAKIEDKYKNKIEEYRNCQDPNLGNLKERWEALKGTINTISVMADKFAERSKNRINKATEKVKKDPGLIMGAAGLVKGGFSAKSFSEFAQDSVNFRVNGENGFSATPWEQIAGGFGMNAPTDMTQELWQSMKNTFAKSSGVTDLDTSTFDSVYGDLQTMDSRNDNQNLDLEYLADLEVKYRKTSGNGLDLLLLKLSDLETIIQDTFKPIDKIKTCTAQIVGKQCGG